MSNSLNSSSSGADEILKRLVAWYDASISELNAVYVLAHTHGWRSNYAGTDPLARIVDDSRVLLSSDSGALR